MLEKLSSKLQTEAKMSYERGWAALNLKLPPTIPHTEYCSHSELVKYITGNEYSRPHVPEDQAVLERFFRTIKQGEVYHEEYENHYQARDGISKFIDYYNHRRPHQGIGFVTPYQKLTGQEEKIFKERKARATVAQEIRKIENRTIDTFTNEEPQLKIVTKEFSFRSERV